MTIRTLSALAGVALAVSAFGLAASTPAKALTMAECSAKYQDAKKAGTLNGQSWNDFRKSMCGTTASTTTPAPTTTTAAPAPTTTTTTTTTATTNLSGTGRDAERARQRQCGAEWKANRVALKAQYGTWPKYWSACNTRIKTTGK